MKRLPRWLTIAGCACAAALAPAANSAPEADIPDFMGAGGGWNMVNTNATDYVDPESGAKPVTNDPKYPHIGNLQPGQKTDRVADLNSPILQEWAKAQIKKPMTRCCVDARPSLPHPCAGPAACRRNCWSRPKSIFCRVQRKSG